jgi:hypothetical protein
VIPHKPPLPGLVPLQRHASERGVRSGIRYFASALKPLSCLNGWLLGTVRSLHSGHGSFSCPGAELGIWRWFSFVLVGVSTTCPSPRIQSTLSTKVPLLRCLSPLSSPLSPLPFPLSPPLHPPFNQPPSSKKQGALLCIENKS